jgi:hypothetical protein
LTILRFCTILPAEVIENKENNMPEVGYFIFAILAITATATLIKIRRRNFDAWLEHALRKQRQEHRYGRILAASAWHRTVAVEVRNNRETRITFALRLPAENLRTLWDFLLETFADRISDNWVVDDNSRRMTLPTAMLTLSPPVKSWLCLELKFGSYDEFRTYLEADGVEFEKITEWDERDPLIAAASLRPLALPD